MLFATAPTIPAMIDCLGKFYCGTIVSLEPVNAREWKVIRTSDGKWLDGVRVTLKGKRYRLEAA